MVLKCMDNKKTNQYYLQKVITDLRFIIAHTKDISQGELEENELLVDSVMFRLIQISENSDRLSEEFKQQHATIPWRAMKGLRNRIVHEYGNVVLSIVYDTVKKDISELLEDLEDIE